MPFLGNVAPWNDSEPVVRRLVWINSDKLD